MYVFLHMCVCVLFWSNNSLIHSLLISVVGVTALDLTLVVAQKQNGCPLQLLLHGKYSLIDSQLHCVTNVPSSGQ